MLSNQPLRPQRTDGGGSRRQFANQRCVLPAPQSGVVVGDVGVQPALSLDPTFLPALLQGTMPQPLILLGPLPHSNQPKPPSEQVHLEAQPLPQKPAACSTVTLAAACPLQGQQHLGLKATLQNSRDAPSTTSTNCIASPEAPRPATVSAVSPLVAGTLVRKETWVLHWVRRHLP